MHDLAEKWSVPPAWRNATIEVPGLKIGAVTGLHQHLVSGDLAAWAEASGFDGSAVGAFGQAEGIRYSVRLARDRLLAVSATPMGVATGWFRDGFAVTEISAGLQMFEVDGPASDAFIARGTTLNPAGQPSAGATLSFAGISAIVYRHQRSLRIHVDRGLAAYLWTWMETAAANIAAGP
ncbi:hypothetical protein C1D09_012335 [Mesorhizobium intechi]|uniref:hypothetical protein n=1 Tax=Mesorhizobium intechi TaxID=537601 RepID=UPI000CA7E139|nr:hypothetical protein [Mesorhizobium intechi]TSE11836.1 hypothetical protein C1D09_012335 [Mesorhizobium intechi]